MRVLSEGAPTNQRTAHDTSEEKQFWNPAVPTIIGVCNNSAAVDRQPLYYAATCGSVHYLLLYRNVQNNIIIYVRNPGTILVQVTFTAEKHYIHNS